jgi:hypothetical protein
MRPTSTSPVPQSSTPTAQPTAFLLTHPPLNPSHLLNNHARLTDSCLTPPAPLLRPASPCQCRPNAQHPYGTAVKTELRIQFDITSRGLEYYTSVPWVVLVGGSRQTYCAVLVSVESRCLRPCSLIGGFKRSADSYDFFFQYHINSACEYLGIEFG